MNFALFSHAPINDTGDFGNNRLFTCHRLSFTAMSLENSVQPPERGTNQQQTNQQDNGDRSQHRIGRGCIHQRQVGRHDIGKQCRPKTEHDQTNLGNGQQPRQPVPPLPQSRDCSHSRQSGDNLEGDGPPMPGQTGEDARRTAAGQQQRHKRRHAHDNGRSQSPPSKIFLQI